MSRGLESRAAKIATLSSVAIASSVGGALLAKEVLRKRQETKDLEYMEQTAGDSRLLFKREGAQLR